MKKELLHKYFSGETTQDENKKIIRWYEKSDTNRSLFLSERKLWNTTHVAESSKGSKENPLRIKKTFQLSQLVKYAASVAVLLVFGTMLWQYVEYGQEEGMQTIMVPAGQRVNLTLADGTTVWLNSNTTMTYPARFNRKKREVMLNGEAYFEVQHNRNCPFVVSTEKYDVEVLGTTFNVFAYANTTFETALFEGSVNILDKTQKKQLLLEPNELAIGRNGTLSKRSGLNPEEYSWQKGILTFNDEPIHNVLSLLHAYYGKEVFLANSNYDSYHCTAKFLYNDGLEYILKVIQRDLHYQIEKDSTNNIIILR